MSTSNHTIDYLSDLPENYIEIVEGLKQIYHRKMLEVEQRYNFDLFYSPFLRSSDFEAKPMVLLLGQYSVGKTSFIEFLLGKKFPGQRVGPEPTTDRFVAVMHGKDERVIPGNALSVDSDKPFHALNKYGTGFLSKFEASVVNSKILENCIIVDTPGVLSGAKQLERSYDFVQVCEWFAERSDLILLLFDAHKLDISDEFKRSIEVLKGNDDKVRIVLNKSDTISTQQLMRVYGALMWSLGKVVQTPEVMRVYIGSFWDKEYQIKDNEKLFNAEREDLFDDLLSLPRNSAVRKINELVKRARLVKVHAHIIGHLKSKMPALFGKEGKQKELINTLSDQFTHIQRTHRLPPGDFPNIKMFKKKLLDKNFSDFEKLSERLLNQMDEVLARDLPQLMNVVTPPKRREESNPFGDNPFGANEIDWIVSEQEFEEYSNLFHSLAPQGGQLAGNKVRGPLLQTGVEKSYLRKIWDMADFDKTGTLDEEEFALCMWLANFVQSGGTLPSVLREEMIPPSKR
eukprot:TRINITY_DN1283_c0_g3_i1.p1 TRINITY_DN1283_c0_g3~~TRINITY_DN1283_c0_g3_i1.p1  ORF type:complete len:514 (-),score=123.05 TRINITY_DN1283_c0_g3_i1:31-1572(-)